MRSEVLPAERDVERAAKVFSDGVSENVAVVSHTADTPRSNNIESINSIRFA